LFLLLACVTAIIIDNVTTLYSKLLTVIPIFLSR
jgi:hypothetical protein